MKTVKPAPKARPYEQTLFGAIDAERADHAEDIRFLRSRIESANAQASIEHNGRKHDAQIITEAIQRGVRFTFEDGRYVATDESGTEIISASDWKYVSLALMEWAAGDAGMVEMARLLAEQAEAKGRLNALTRRLAESLASA